MKLKSLFQILAACAFAGSALAQPATTGTLKTAVPVPIVMNGKQVGSTTLPAGAKVTLVQESAGKTLIKAAVGETWVANEALDVAAPEPVAAAATPAPEAPATGGSVAPATQTVAEPEASPRKVSHGTGNPNVIRIAIVDGGVTNKTEQEGNETVIRINANEASRMAAFLNAVWPGPQKLEFVMEHYFDIRKDQSDTVPENVTLAKPKAGDPYDLVVMYGMGSQTQLNKRMQEWKGYNILFEQTGETPWFVGAEAPPGVSKEFSLGMKKNPDPAIVRAFLLSTTATGQNQHWEPSLKKLQNGEKVTSERMKAYIKALNEAVLEAKLSQ